MPLAAAMARIGAAEAGPGADDGAGVEGPSTSDGAAGAVVVAIEVGVSDDINP